MRKVIFTGFAMILSALSLGAGSCTAEAAGNIPAIGVIHREAGQPGIATPIWYRYGYGWGPRWGYYRYGYYGPRWGYYRYGWGWHGPYHGCRASCGPYRCVRVCY